MKADYYFGDIATQQELLSKQIDNINAGINARHIKAGGKIGVAVIGLIDKAKCVRAMHKRVAKFYGLDNKYDGKGNLRF